MYAVIENGGKQYKVSVGQTIDVERLPAAVGQTVELTTVLLLADNGEVVVGKPTIDGAKVMATVTEQGRGRKIIVFKFRGGNRYQRKRGHRQSYTRLRIEEILREDLKRKKPSKVAVAEELGVSKKKRVKHVPVSLDELDLPARTTGTLKAAGIESVEDLLKKDDDELLGIRGFGAKSLEQVRESLKAKGFIKK